MSVFKKSDNVKISYGPGEPLRSGWADEIDEEKQQAFVCIISTKTKPVSYEWVPFSRLSHPEIVNGKYV